MFQVRSASDRGVAQFGWLDSRHTFSFGQYYDPRHMGFSALRVINEDKVQPGAGFGTHGHQDMEIITYVLRGALKHQDSLGNQSIIREGDVQRMTAGTGIRHSEFNASSTESVHFLQIWILPDTSGLPPSYEEIHLDSVPSETAEGVLQLVGSRDGRDESVTIHQDVSLYVARPHLNQTLHYSLKPERSLWLQVAKGSLQVNDRSLTAGDAVAVADLETLAMTGQSADAEALLFDLARQ